MNHEGHRQRLYEKLKTGGYLHEHELLEMLLFNAYPRRNTNAIAHSLLDAFGSLRGVFDADISALTEIYGVGESVACYLKCVAACAMPAYCDEGQDVYLKNYGDFKEFVARRLRKKTEETLELYFFDKGGRVKYIYSRTDSDKHKVTAQSKELSALIAARKPYGLLIAHNHLTGDSSPSAQDDKFTGEMEVLCSLNGVTLYDHCIYASDNNVFSYFDTGKIDRIRDAYNVNALIKNQKP